ncbi:MAG: NAD(P)H-dependent oxidoreductase [Cytophagales bacterium]|nr:NAD(P)H-dependent oxidoreductase [Cytophagales bacterium]
MNITIISSSTRPESITYRIALHIHHKMMNMQDINPTLLDLRKLDIPMYTYSYQDHPSPSHGLQIFHDTIYSCDAFIVVTPEYNGGYNAALKNAIDHLGKDAYQRKAMGIVTGSTGALAAARVSQQLQLLACGIFAIPCPQMLLVPQMDKKFDTEGNLTDPNFEKSINTFFDNYLWLAQALYQKSVKI